jgi:exodeoxyribonuclease V gamma subunit
MAPDARQQVLVRHPLQPFDACNFAAGDLGRPEPFSFDRAELDGALAASGPRSPRPPLLAAALPARARDDVTLTDLQSFFRSPVGAFLRQRLDVGLPQEYDEVDDALPVELDALSQWAIGDRVLRRAVDGADPTGVFLAEQLRGDLPPLRLGERLLQDICVRVDALYRASAGDRQAAPRSVDVTVDLGGGRRLTGVVPDVRGNRVVRVHYSALSPRHRLAGWLDLLALSAGLPDQSWTSRIYGWHNRVGVAQHALAGPLDHTAVDVLRDLVEVYDRGLREPLPVPCRTAYAWADAVRAHRDPRRAAAGAWETQDTSPVPGEREDAAHVRVFGRDAPVTCLLAEPRADEAHAGERTRLGAYARRIWDPLFAVEQVETA